MMGMNVATGEYIFACLMIPIMYVLVYIAGKHDFLGVLCKMLEEKAKQLENDTKKEDENC